MDVFTSSKHGRCGHVTQPGQLGFTLIELLITLAIISIVFGIGMPSVNAVMERNRITAAVNQLSASMALTRSEAVKRNEHVVACKSIDGQQCVRTGRWDMGWIIFEDSDHDRYRGDDEPLIRVIEGFNESIQIDYRGFGSSHYVTYHPGGYTKTNGTFTFCANDDETSASALILYKTGRIRFSKTSANGGQLNCPES